MVVTDTFVESCDLRDHLVGDIIGEQCPPPGVEVINHHLEFHAAATVVVDLGQDLHPVLESLGKHSEVELRHLFARIQVSRFWEWFGSSGTPHAVRNACVIRSRLLQRIYLLLPVFSRGVTEEQYAMWWQRQLWLLCFVEMVCRAAMLPSLRRKPQLLPQLSKMAAMLRSVVHSQPSNLQ
jgi:hypothetical protein